MAGREAWKDNVTFTNIRLSLVRTAMVAPTEAYAKARTESPEQAAAKIVRALEDRPLTVNTVAASVVEVLNLAAPRFTDFAFRSEEHTSELQSLMRISYAVFCLKNNKQQRLT